MASLACALAAFYPAQANEPHAPYPMGEGYYLENGAERKVAYDGHKLTILHFWATWCPPCLPELPQVDAIADRYADKGVQVLAVSMDTDPAKVQAFFEKTKIEHLKPLLDSGSKTFRAAKVKGLPSTLFINDKGEVVHNAPGPVKWEEPSTTDFIEKQIK